MMMTQFLGGAMRSYTNTPAPLSDNLQPQMDETENVTETSVNAPLSFDDESVVYDEVLEFTLHTVYPAAHSQFSGDQVAPIELKSNSAYHTSNHKAEKHITVPENNCSYVKYVAINMCL